MTVIGTHTIGLEAVQRAALTQLVVGLNDAIAQAEADWADSDMEMATLLQRAYVPTVIERVDLTNFYEGHRPSLISAPIDNYPNCAAWSLRAAPTPESAELDHSSVYNDLLYVEVMVKAIEDEETVNRRVQRTAEAVNFCITQDETLGGVVSGFVTEPLLTLTDVFTRKERTSYGPEWFWQGARLEYAVRKDAVIPSSSPGSIFRAAPATPPMMAGLNIDQM